MANIVLDAIFGDQNASDVPVIEVLCRNFGMVHGYSPMETVHLMLNLQCSVAILMHLSLTTFDFCDKRILNDALIFYTNLMAAAALQGSMDRCNSLMQTRYEFTHFQAPLQGIFRVLEIDSPTPFQRDFPLSIMRKYRHLLRDLRYYSCGINKSNIKINEDNILWILKHRFISEDNMFKSGNDTCPRNDKYPALPAFMMEMGMYMPTTWMDICPVSTYMVEDMDCFPKDMYRIETLETMSRHTRCGEHDLAHAYLERISSQFMKLNGMRITNHGINLPDADSLENTKKSAVALVENMKKSAVAAALVGKRKREDDDEET